jgi:hypothetical protein
MRLGSVTAIALAAALVSPSVSSGDHVQVRIRPVAPQIELSANELETGVTATRAILTISPPGAAADPQSSAHFCHPGTIAAETCDPSEGEIVSDTVRWAPPIAGRYEARVYAWTDFHWSPSNIARFDVVDPCRWTGTTTVKTGAPPGGPVPCHGGGAGSADLTSSDGTRLRLRAKRIRWSLSSARRRQIPMDTLLLEGHDSGAEIRIRTGPRIGRFLVLIQTAGAQVVLYGPADVSVTHSGKVTSVSVRRGFAVGYRERRYNVYSHIRRRCGGRPTAKCLARIQYVVGGLRKRVERATVVRPGQTARFRYRGV